MKMYLEIPCREITKFEVEVRKEKEMIRISYEE